MKKIFLAMMALFISSHAYAIESGLTGQDQEIYLSYQRHHDIPIAAASLGPTAPSVVKTGTAICFAFDADAEEAGIVIEIPHEWIGTSDLEFNIEWHLQSGDVIAAGETVKWDVEWHSIAEGEPIDNGTVATGTVTYTQDGAGTDKQTINSSITIPYTGGNQPITAEDWFLLTFNRDVSADTYSGDAIICKTELEYIANKLATH